MSNNQQKEKVFNPFEALVEELIDNTKRLFPDIYEKKEIVISPLLIREIYKNAGEKILTELGNIIKEKGFEINQPTEQMISARKLFCQSNEDKVINEKT